MGGPDTGRPARPHRKDRPGRRPARSPRTPSLDPARASPPTYLLRPRAGPPAVVWARQAPLEGRRPMPRHPAPSFWCAGRLSAEMSLHPFPAASRPACARTTGLSPAISFVRPTSCRFGLRSSARGRLALPVRFAARRPSLSSALLSRLRACPRPAPWALLGRTTLARAPSPRKGRDVFSAPHRLCRRIRKNIASNP